jgi:hypothetical protein
MITSRAITPDDFIFLENSLKDDEFHKDTPPEFFYEDGTITNIYSDEKGIVLFLRGKPFIKEELGVKAIWLDIQFYSNKDYKRNLKVMLEGLPLLAKSASKNGFTAFIFESDVPLLRKFCIRRLGFTELDKYLVKVLEELPELAIDKCDEVV